ncbi:hypothetical protein D3C84_1110120 [compost metagenome]
MAVDKAIFYFVFFLPNYFIRFVLYQLHKHNFIASRWRKILGIQDIALEPDILFGLINTFAGLKVHQIGSIIFGQALQLFRQSIYDQFSLRRQTVLGIGREMA